MNAVIGIYDNFEKAVKAFTEMEQAEYPVRNISFAGLIGHSTITTEGTHLNKELAGHLTSTSLGLMTEAAIFRVPEYGYLFAAGGVVATIARLNRHDQFAGISTIMREIGVDIELSQTYTKNLEQGRYMVLVHGDSKQITIASEILEKHITYSEAAGNHVNKFDLGNWIKNLDTDFPLGG